MKKTLLFLFCTICSIALNAQRSESKVYTYGVDFTHAKVFGAKESVDDFAKAFYDINMLLVTEADKYDFSRVVKQPVYIAIEPMLNITSEATYDNMKTLSNIYDEPNCAEIIENYELPQTEGTGIVIIAKLLDKPNACATYDLVVFDIATRNILTKKETVGDAEGFGLRNYWARSVYNVIRKTKIKR